uniref:Germ cell-less 1, spermatosis associated n=1 Tax=Zonotrichia albicollis TaxID=44394 RepID=A0A8D2MIS0_ZONAL
MFSGSWKESSMNVIELEIPDQNIDVEALQVAFGSLYRDDVLINPSRVVALLAAACMLQLDGLIQQCGETMKETITAQTVCGYYNSAGTYGLDSVKKKCLEWLLNNLMTHQSVGLFKELSINLMKQLISSSNLFVLQVEMDVYTALKKWMFLQLVPSWNGSFKQVLTEADAWFAERRREFGGDVAFLESAQGSAFVPVFAHLRLQYIISDLASARIVERDALLPSGEAGREGWHGWASLHSCLGFLQPRADTQGLGLCQRGQSWGGGWSWWVALWGQGEGTQGGTAVTGRGDTG